MMIEAMGGECFEVCFIMMPLKLWFF